MVTRTQAIKNFLIRVTHADLADLYSYDMECQVNVAQDGGERVGGNYMGRAWNGWTDGLVTWKSFRIPRNANKEPEYEDKPMKFPLDHAEGVGMTGWDWNNRLSRWVAFDFDAIAGHKEAHEKKLTEIELDVVKKAAIEIPWVTVRRSAGGAGLHLYVFLDPPVPTQNHNEHAALARAILSKMSAMAGYDFHNKVDICGQNMWVYHRKMLDSDGLKLIKKGSTLGSATQTEIPANWQDHIKVVKGQAARNLPKFLDSSMADQPTDSERMFLELMGQQTRVPLDEGHKRLIKYLEERGTQSWWDADHHILITHTFHLKEAHEALSLRGIFETASKGTEAPNDHNCFLNPLRNGAWVVRRYSMGCSEAATWDQDGRGYTRCYYNRNPDLSTAARAKDGVESPSGGFVFKEAELALDVAKQIGANVPSIPVGLRTKRSTIKKHSDGRLIVEIEGDTEGVSAGSMPGWLHDKGKWKRIFTTTSLQPTEVEAPSYDDLIRHVVTEGGEEYGWMLKDSDGEWTKKDLAHIRVVMDSLGLPKKDINQILGNSVTRAWKLVSRPFQPEYIGDRLWNRGAAQLRFVPSQEDKLTHPSWDRILMHAGKSLDSALEANPWAIANGIKHGGEYLKIWIASLFKHPLEPLPYLFLYSEHENTGKSILHEALSLLMTKGYQRADVALQNQQSFSGELRGAVLCVVEEVNLGKNQQARERIKDLVTAREILIHPKGRTPYHVRNTTHWIQTANSSSHCPTFPGDTRITMMYVHDLTQEEEIPKPELLSRLEKEAPDFLGALMKLEIPPSTGRLRVPMISTVEKIQTQQSNRTPLQSFLEDKCFYVPGSVISVAEFYDVFSRYVDPDELPQWGKKTVNQMLPPQFPKGRLAKDGHHYIGNISFDRAAKATTRLIAKQGIHYIMLEPESNGSVELQNGDSVPESGE